MSKKKLLTIDDELFKKIIDSQFKHRTMYASEEIIRLIEVGLKTESDEI